MTSKKTDLVLRIAEFLTATKQHIVTAESCTGGGVGAALTDIPGSSAWYEQGYITYSNGAKERMLDVPNSLLLAHGAVSHEVVEAMLRGALARAKADIGIAISGIAGPGGATATKPVGTVCIAWGSNERHCRETFLFDGDRSVVRELAIERALSLTVAWLEQEGVKV